MYDLFSDDYKVFVKCVNLIIQINIMVIQNSTSTVLKQLLQFLQSFFLISSGLPSQIFKPVPN